jgi:hypothetical protein
LVNRIGFDGSVVSDSNNYKKSEAVIRKLEKQYNLLTVEPSSNVPRKAPGKPTVLPKNPGNNDIPLPLSTC